MARDLCLTGADIEHAKARITQRIQATSAVSADERERHHSETAGAINALRWLGVLEVAEAYALEDSAEAALRAAKAAQHASDEQGRDLPRPCTETQVAVHSDDTLRRARAKSFCIAAHSAVGQLRKYTDEPYWTHPLEVARLLQDATHQPTEDMVIAAMLHDVSEDTGVTLSLIEDEFGFDVAALVDELTKATKPEDGTRAVRKELDRKRLANASVQAKTIKLADMISNTRTVTVLDPEFAKVYLKEARLLLAVLHDADPALLARATEIVEDGLEQLQADTAA